MIRRIYDHIAPTLPPGITWEIFESLYRDWAFTPLDMGGETIGAVISRGPELHVVYFTPPQGSIIRHIRATLARIVAEHGYAETYVEPWNEAGINFTRRLGFEQVGMRGQAIYMRCDTLKHQRQK